jgi:signal transduction histidine kinase
MEPYFSTKMRGVTTGMGLSMVHGLVEAVGGRVEVDSTVGRGTTVRLHLPMAARAEELSTP